MSGWTPAGPALLFCPADRPDRYAKAAERADAVIIDLEDAVAPADRPRARRALAESTLDPARVIVRLNAVGSPDHAADVAAVGQTTYRCVMLAKTESAEAVTRTAEKTGLPVIALLETPLGVVRAVDIAAAEGTAAMMWGAEDLVAAMGGCTSRFGLDEAAAGRPAGGYRDVPRQARASVAIAAAAFGRWAIDAVHLDLTDLAGQEAESRDAAALGFAATACLHPAQVPVIRAAYAPTEPELAWARRVMAASAQYTGVFRLDDQMIDEPLLRQAERTLRRGKSAAPSAPD